MKEEFLHYAELMAFLCRVDKNHYNNKYYCMQGNKKNYEGFGNKDFHQKIIIIASLSLF